jgi:hypothetical protein
MVNTLQQLDQVLQYVCAVNEHLLQHPHLHSVVHPVNYGEDCEWHCTIETETQCEFGARVGFLWSRRNAHLCFCIHPLKNNYLLTVTVIAKLGHLKAMIVMLWCCPRHPHPMFTKCWKPSFKWTLHPHRPAASGRFACGNRYRHR